MSLVNVTRKRKTQEWIVILFLAIILFNTLNPFLITFGIAIDKVILFLISVASSYIFEDAIRGLIRGELK